MPYHCKQADCTVLQTEKCLLNNDPNSCPERVPDESPASEFLGEIAPPLDEPLSRRQLPSSFTLSLEEAARLMGNRYCKVIGILGLPDAGKTAALVCIYLLLARNRLSGYEFRDSRTLMALEEISRGARRWTDADRGQLTSHTESPDERAAGFIHLRLLKCATEETLDLLIPDLPGEWSTRLIDSNRTDRLRFLKAADVLWLMVDGTELMATVTRKSAIHKLSLLLQRVYEMLTPRIPTTFLVVSRQDKTEIPPTVYTKLLEQAEELRIDLRVLQIASFSESDTVQPGSGIVELIDAATSTETEEVPFWSDRPRASLGTRAVLNFRAQKALKPDEP